MTRAVIALGALGALLGACASSYGRMETDLVFTRYSPLARSAEVARRTLPPVAYHRIEQELAGTHEQLAEQAIDLAGEKFDIYVPYGAPPAAGYALLVYIAPASGPTRPIDWHEPLDRRHVVFVSAQNAGNATNVLDRRVPLTLLAYENARSRFPIDPRRVYVMGFSGGARVAEIVALGYPDIFHGAILNAGSDPIDGKDGNYKPPAELFRAFQRSRLVFITGEEDLDHIRRDGVSQGSLRDNCVLDLQTEIALRLGHHAIDGFALDRALTALERPPAIDPDELDRCNARVEAELSAALSAAAAAIARGDREAARAQLTAIDVRFGGLAAPRILELDARLAARP
jgi:pimeloyl-ACP methyl ester carboxylesterase